MKKEVFDISVNNVGLIVKTDLPVGPGNDAHEIWKGNDLLFVIRPHTEESNMPCWKLTQEYANINIDNEFISEVGDAIESHYL